MKILYALLGAAGALLLKTILDERRAGSGVARRVIPADRHAGAGSPEEEITGPLVEI